MREDHVRGVLDEARHRLGEVTKDPTKYSAVLLSLITQGLYQIMEPKATIRVRQADVGLLEEILPKALQEYKDKTKKEVAVTLDKENFLPADTCGGVELRALNGRLRVSKMNSVTDFYIYQEQFNFFSTINFTLCRCQTRWKRV